MDKNTKLTSLKISSSRKLLKASLWGHLFNDMYWFIIPLVLPLIKTEMNLNYTQSGLLFTSYTLIGAFGSLITGYLGDRRGRRFILSWGFFLGSVALVFCALSGNYWQLFFSLVLLGVGISAFHPSMIAILSTSFYPRKGTVLGIFQFWGVVGTMGVVLLISFLTRFTHNWRGIILILSIPGFIVAPLLFRLLNSVPEELNIKDEKRQSFPSTKNTRRIFPVLIFMIANALFLMTSYSVINFIPTYLVEVKTLSITIAGYSFLIAMTGGLFGTIWGGRLSDRLNPLVALAGIVALGGPVIISMTFIENYTFLILCLLLYGVSYFGIWAPQQAYLAEKTPRTKRGGIYGVIFFIGNIVGAIAPGLTGILADKLGLTNSLRVITLPLFLSLFLIYLVGKKDTFEKLER
ncbi:MFS transporter [Candidatus Aerophobetes bacterium]|nr:MFS transporter [Candidatus Aerophobetes bacterium]